MNQESRPFFWATNLKFLRNRKKLSQEALAEAMGITRSKLNAHENGQTKNPVLDDLIGFSEYFKIGIDALVKANLSELSEAKLRELEAGNDTYSQGRQIRILATTVDSKNQDNMELVPQKARAGYTSGYSDPDFIASLPTFSLPQLPKDRKHRMFPISGDSMHPVPDGAFVVGEYVEDWMGLPANAPCIVVTKSDGIVFKLVSLKPSDAKTLILESLNELYKPYEVSIAEVLEIWRFKGLLTNQLPYRETPNNHLSKAIALIGSDVKKLLRQSGISSSNP